MMNGKKEGQGTLVYRHGEIYQGVWKNGFKEGEGVWILNDGTIINGFWLNNQLQPHVEIKFANGDFYKGEVKSTISGELKFHGRGILKSHTGDTYQGDFKEGLREGYGKYSYKDGANYEGYWVRGKKGKIQR